MSSTALLTLEKNLSLLTDVVVEIQMAGDYQYFPTGEFKFVLSL